MKKLVTILVVLAMAIEAQVALASVYSNVVKALGPVGYWEFEDNYNDSSGNGVTLTTYGAPEFAASAGLPGMGAKAMHIPLPVTDYSYAYVDTSTGPGSVLNLSGTAYSINLWVANERAAGLWETLVMNRDEVWDSGAGSNYGLDTWLDTGTSGYRAWPANSLSLPGTASTGTDWHMLTLSVDLSGSPQYKLYIDGALVSSNSHSLTSIQGGGKAFIVGFDKCPLTDQTAGSQWFQGSIDELAVFNKALTPAEITALYAAASSTAATLTGQVHLEGFGGVPQDVLVRVELRQGATVDVRRVTPDAGWGFSLSDINPGTYDIAIKAPGWLQTVLIGKVVQGTTVLDPVTLLAGDLDTDGEITSTDLALLLGNME